MPENARGTQLRLHAFEPCSRVNGPGPRAVVWVQGCTLGCPGCFNPGSHPADGRGGLVAVEYLSARVRALGGTVEGITVSGGEPLQQAPAVVALLQAVRRGTGLSAVVFTGYCWSELRRMADFDGLCAVADVVIAGRYDQSRRVARGLVASASKSLHFLSDRYGPDDFAGIPEAEAVIGPDGSISLTGIDPIRLV